MSFSGSLHHIDPILSSTKHVLFCKLNELKKIFLFLDGQVMSLVELAAREVACHIPFEVVEHVYPPVPEQLQLRIACWSFPENEEDIR